METYLLLLRDAPEARAHFADLTPEEMQAVIQKYEDWAAGLAAEGLLLDGKKLTDGEGRVVHRAGAQPTAITDGPFAETKEVVGGFYLIRAGGFDHAVELCQGHPNLEFGSIEVRRIDLMGAPEDEQG